MIFTQSPLSGAYLIDLEKKGDDRGFFARYYCEKEFAAHNLNTQWAQVNNSLSVVKGTIRGLHFQHPPHAEVKLIRCLTGSIWDVIVDIRKNSPTYGKWFGAELNAENRTMMYVPKGFAHGFITLTDNAEILYLVSTPYSQQAEGALRWNDPFHGIVWPGACTVLSEKDKNVRDWQPNDGVIID